MKPKQNYSSAPEGSRRSLGGSNVLYHLGRGVWVQTTKDMADVMDKI